MPLGPSSTTAPPYLPVDYHTTAFPSWPQQATHKITSTQAGLHVGVSMVKVSPVANQNLNQKKELVDHLTFGTEVIVFNEACGFNGQWAQVLIVGADGFYKYTDDDNKEIKRLFVMNEHLEKLPGTGPSHPIVEPEKVNNILYDVAPSNWRNEPIDTPFFDNRTGNYCIVLERRKDDAEEAVLNSNKLRNYLKAARFKGTKLLLDYYQKDYPPGLLRGAGILESLDAAWADIDIPLIDDEDAGSRIEGYFSFARAEEYHIEPRTYTSAIKILVRIPQIYFDTYKVKKSSRSISQTLMDAENYANIALDQNNGMINTNIVRDWMRSGFENDAGELPDWMTNEEKSIEIYGEDVIIVAEDAVARTILSPDEITRETQERIGDLNDMIGDTPEHIYNRLIPGEARDNIEATLKAVRDAYQATQGVADDITDGLQATIDTINLVTDTLDAAPEIDSVNDAMFRALADPTVNMGDISNNVLYGAGTIEDQKRRYQDRNLNDVLVLLDNTLIKEMGEAPNHRHGKYHDLIKNKIQISNSIDELLRGDETGRYSDYAHQKLKKELKKADEDIDELVSTIKQIEFYVQLTVQEFKDGTTKWLPMILEHLEEQKVQFDGDVKGWMPEVDAGRTKEAYNKIIKYLEEQSVPIDKLDNKDSIIELALTKNHRLIYVGCLYPNDNKVVSSHHYGESFESFSQRTMPLESQTIMAYIWKLNDIRKDRISMPGMYAEGTAVFRPDDKIPLTTWGSKYVYPRPTFIAKPKRNTDITNQRKKNDKELNLLNVKKDRDFREDGQRRIKQAVQAVDDIEANVDSTIGEANSTIKNINSADDTINNYFGALAQHDPYTAAAIKCLIPKLDFDLLPEIPDFDLEWLRNPLMKILELWELIVPPGDLLAAIAKGLKEAWEQAKKLAYVTLVKLLLESLAAACLQAQAALLAGALESVDALLDLVEPENENPTPEDIIANLATERQSTIVSALNEAGIFSSEHLSMPEAIRHAKELFSDISSLLAPVEICQLISGNPPEYILSLIINLIAVKHRHFIGVIDSKSKIIELFSVFGKYIDNKLCDEIISQHENRTIFSDAYKNLHCSISSELDRVRKELLSCNSNLTPEMIDDIIARENEENLERVQALVTSFNAETIDLLPPFVIENAAADHAQTLAVEAMFQGANETLKKELQEYSQHIKNEAERNMPPPTPPYDATILEVLQGTRLAKDLPRPTEIAPILREQLKTIEDNAEYFGFNFSIFGLEEGDGGFKIKLRSLGEHRDEGDQVLIDIATKTGSERKTFSENYNESPSYSSFDTHADQFISKVAEYLPTAPAAQEKLMEHWKSQGVAVEMNCREFEKNDNQYYQTGYSELDWFHDKGNWNSPKYNNSKVVGKLPRQITSWQGANTWFANIIRSQSDNFKNAVYEEEGGISIHDINYRLRIPTYTISKVRASDIDTFELLFQTYRGPNGITSEGLNEFMNQATSGSSDNNEDVVAVDKYSLIVRNAATGENKFMYSKEYSPMEFTRDYIREHLSDIDLTDKVESPQQIYFHKLIDSKLNRSDLFTSEDNRNNFKLFLQYGVFSQITRDIIAFLGKKIATSKYFEFSDVEENSKALSHLELLDLSSKSEDLFGLEKLKSEAVKKIKKNESGDLPEPPDATIQRQHFNAFEVGCMEQTIKAIIRVYIIEFLIKSIFASSTFALSEDVEEVFHDYILQKLKLDLLSGSWSSKIFNYKFKYLARGIWQDNLERALQGDDHDIDYVLTQYIIEQYADVRQVFNAITGDTLTAEEEGELAALIQGVSEGLTNLQNLDFSGGFAGASISGGEEPTEEEGEEPLTDIGISTSTIEFLNQLPVKDNLNQASNIEFYDAADNILKNGNFYFEKYIKATFQDGQSKIFSLLGFLDKAIDNIDPTANAKSSYDSGVISYENLITIGAMIKNRAYENLKLGHWANDHTMGKYLDHLMPYGATQDEVNILFSEAGDIPSEYFYHGGAVTLNATGDEKAGFSEYNIWAAHVDALITTLAAQYITPETVATTFSTVSHGLRLVYLLPYGDHTEQTTTLTHPEGQNTSSKYSLNIDEVLQTPTIDTSELSNHKLEKISWYGGDGVEKHVYTITLAHAEHLYGGNIISLLDNDLLYPSTVYNRLRSSLNLNEEVRFLFNYIFPIEKYKTLMSIYSVESMNEMPGLESMLTETKLELRSVFNIMDSRGRFTYSNHSKLRDIENIQKEKVETVSPPSPPVTVAEQIEQARAAEGSSNQSRFDRVIEDESDESTGTGPGEGSRAVDVEGAEAGSGGWSNEAITTAFTGSGRPR